MAICVDNKAVMVIIIPLLMDITSGGNSSVPELGNRTIIAFEVPEKFFSDLFILGGYTGGDEARCTENNVNSPCSVPITHVMPRHSSAAYENWASGDRYLDLEGREPQQGHHKGEKAYGTPLRRVKPEEAKYKLRIRDLAYRPNQAYWMVELNMDCNKTNGYFEVESVVRTRTNKIMYESLKRPLPDAFTPVTSRTEHSRSRDEVHKRRSFMEPHVFAMTKQCVGSVHMDVPYDSHRHIGLCGKVNIFRFRLPYCEINELLNVD